MRLAPPLNAYHDSFLEPEMRQHCTPVRNISIRERGGVGEGRCFRSLAIMICEHLGPATVARRAVALKAQRVIAIGANGAAILKPGFPFLAGLAVLAMCFRLVGGRK